jgi:cobalt-zinc-cadmium efflux system outer membrane protein
VLDVDAQRAEAMRARDDALRLAWDVSVAEQRLLYLLGLTGVVDHVDVSLSPTPIVDLSPEELERRALAARPDVRASELAVEAAGERSTLAVAEIFALSGIADANGAGKQGFEIGPGAQLPLPILNQNQAGRQRAGAELERAAWNYRGTRQRVMLEVRTAHVRCRQAIEAWQRWSTELVPSLENLVHASQTAYEIGELSPLNVQENARQLIVARVREAELAAEVRRAWAELERSVGTRLLTGPQG